MAKQKAKGNSHIKHARISLIVAGADGKEKHVAVDIADADKIVKHGVSDEAGTLLSVLENIVNTGAVDDDGNVQDAGKVFITPDFACSSICVSEKDSDALTYLLRGKKQQDPPPPAA